MKLCNSYCYPYLLGLNLKFIYEPTEFLWQSFEDVLSELERKSTQKYYRKPRVSNINLLGYFNFQGP